MFAQEKRSLILSYGNAVEVYGSQGQLLHTTKALIGKATRTAMSEFAHEYHRKALFVPELDIPNGVIVADLTTKSKYIGVATLDEVYMSEKLSTILRLIECNGEVTITGLEETADENGDVITAPVVKVQNKPVHILPMSAELLQFMPGLHPNAEYIIYMSAAEVSLLDKVTVKSGGREVKLKIEYIDYLSFEGVALLHVCTETRT